MSLASIGNTIYNKVHALILVQPFNRVVVTKGQYGGSFWQASLTRTFLNAEPARVVTTTAINTLFKIKPKARISTFGNATIDEINYSILIAELSTCRKLSIGNDLLIEFIPIRHVLDEVLDDVREYSEDSKRVLTHLSNFIRQDRIGDVILGRTS